MAFNVNPLMAEYAGISPGLKAALSSAGQAPPMNAPAITPQMKADAQPVNAGPAPEIPGIHMPDAPVPQLGSPRMPDSINPILGTTHGDTLNRESLLQHGPTVDHIASRIEGSGFGQDHPVLGKILGDTAQVAGKIGDTALNIGGSLGIPAINTLARDIPGTTQNYNHELRGANANLTQDTTNAQKEAQTASENATASKTNAETPTIAPLAKSKEDLDASEIAEHNAQAAALLHPKAKTDFEAWQQQNPGKPIEEWLKAQQSAKPPKTHEVVSIGKDGKPHNLLQGEEGNTIADEGVHYERPQVTNINENHQFAEQERGRGLLDKAEGSYRTAQQGANTMRDMVASARGGNKMSAQVLPLEGALAITTAQGVHRINRTEVDQYSGAGNLYDKIAGEVGKLTEGQPIPPNILQDIEQLTAIQEKGAYQTYKGAYDSATRRYKLNDEKPIDAPGVGAPQGGSSGKGVSLNDARQLPQYNGKSDDEIKADITKYGHTVLP